MNAVRRGGAGDKVDFDTKVSTCFEECCVCGFGEDPGGSACIWRSRLPMLTFLVR